MTSRAEARLSALAKGDTWVTSAARVVHARRNVTGALDGVAAAAVENHCMAGLLVQGELRDGLYPSCMPAPQSVFD